MSNEGPSATRRTSSTPSSKKAHGNEAPRPTSTAARNRSNGAPKAAGDNKPAGNRDGDRVDTNKNGKVQNNVGRLIGGMDWAKDKDDKDTRGADKNDNKPEDNREDVRTRKFERDGYDVRQTSYKLDGANVRETVRTKDGYRQEITSVEKDGKTERTVQTTRLVDKPIEDVVPGYQNLEPNDELDHAPPDAPQGELQTGERGPVRVTSVKRTVSEPGKDPVTLDQSKSYTQFTPTKADKYDDPRVSESGTGSLSVVGAPGDPQFQQKGSGQSIAITQTRVKNGESVNQSTYARRNTMNWRDPDNGRKFQTVSNYTQNYSNGKKTDGAATSELRGLKPNEVPQIRTAGANPNDLPENIDINQKYQGKYYDKLKPENGYDGPADVRYGTSWGPGGAQSYEQIGDLDGSREPGSRSVTRISGGEDEDGNSLRDRWKVRQVDEGENPGEIRVREQTSASGTKGYTLDDTTYRRDGTFTGTTTVKNDDGDTDLQIKREGKPVDASDVEGFTSDGDETSREIFLGRNRDKQLYQTTTEVENNTDGDDPPSGTTTTFTAKGSNDRLQYQQQSDYTPVGRYPVAPDEDARTNTVTALETPGTNNSQRVTSDDGTVLTTDRNGNVTGNKDGQTFNVGRVPKGDVLNPSGTNGQAFADIQGAVNNWKERGPEAPDGIDKDDVAGEFEQLKRFPTDRTPDQLGETSETLETANNVTTIGGSALEIGERAAGATTNVGGLLGGAAKVTNAVGAPVNILQGIDQIQNGDEIGGALSITAGVAGGGALAASFGGAALASLVPGLGLVAATATLGGTVYTLIKGEPDFNRTADLQF